MKVPLLIFAALLLYTAEAATITCDVKRLSESRAEVVCRYPENPRHTKQNVVLIMYSPGLNEKVCLCSWGNAGFKCSDKCQADVENVSNELKFNATLRTKADQFACDFIPAKNQTTAKRCTVPPAVAHSTAAPPTNVTGSAVDTTLSVGAWGNCDDKMYIAAIVILIVAVVALSFVLLLTCICHKRLQRRFKKYKDRMELQSL